MDQQNLRDTISEFKLYLERIGRYWYCIGLSLNGPVQEGTEIRAMIYPGLMTRRLMKDRELPLCLFNDKFTRRTANILGVALEEIKKRQGLNSPHGLAFMIYIYIMGNELIRVSHQDLPILYRPPLKKVIKEMKDRDKNSKQEIKRMVNNPFTNLDEFLDAWNQFGRLCVDGFGSHNGSEGRWFYFTIPPSWIPIDKCEAFFEGDESKQKILINVEKSHLPIINTILSDKGILKAQLYRHTKIARFPTPSGTKWEDIEIAIMSIDSIRITVKDVYRRYNYSEIGLKDRRKGDLPNMLWDLLREFAENHGRIDWETSIDPRYKKDLKKNISRLRKILKEIMGIDADPFHKYRRHKAYLVKFQISDMSPR